VGGSVTVTDLRSRNGTLVQRQAVQRAVLPESARVSA